MKELLELLENPFDMVSKGNRNELQKKCDIIAQELFRNYCIKCDDKEYSFAEIEFYYYEKGIWEEEWNKVTYARDDYKAGALFYHLSGIDICFDSHYKNQPAKFGGVLIRAIRNEKGIIIAGPLTCKDEILNACKCGTMPQLSRATHTHHVDIKSTYRALGKDDTDKENDRLCFFDSLVTDWNPNKKRYNTKKGSIEPKKGAYKTNRFNVSN